MNFKNFGNETPLDRGGGGGGGSQLPLDIYSLPRQTSIYSMTFDELQSSMGGMGKEFGSMNMDELLKSIWTAEETQTMAAMAGGFSSAAIPGGSSGGEGVSGGGFLQRQGSLTLPRTLSQKTVDEVWKCFQNDVSIDLGPNLEQRQQTLGEMTLEEFLVKAGVVREDVSLTRNDYNRAFFGESSQSSNCISNSNIVSEIGFQQAHPSMGFMGNRITDNTNQISIPSANLPMIFNGSSSQSQPQQIFPKQTAIPYATPISLPPTAAQLANSKGIVGYSDQGRNGHLPKGFQIGTVGLGAGGAVTIATGSPSNQMSNGDTSSVSPVVPYVFNVGVRGRRSGPVEKVVERRQRRMIKNRESAARSRARKQAYTVELETEVAKLKEENVGLQKKQEIMEIQEKKVLEMINMEKRGKKTCLRRTMTGPW